MATRKASAQPRRPFPVPYGLFAILAVYALLVVGYIWATYWRSPEYQAAEHYAQALRLLGVDDGRSCSQVELERAFHHVLEAARLMPDVKELAVHAERLRWRFDERHFTLDQERQRRAEAVSALARRREQEKDPMLVVGLRDRGWGPEQLLAGPEQAALWSLPGGVLIILVWAYLRFSARAVRDREHEEDLRGRERELERLGDFRRGLEGAPGQAEATRRERGPEDEVTALDKDQPRSWENEIPTLEEQTALEPGERTELAGGEDEEEDPERTRRDRGPDRRAAAESREGGSRLPSQRRPGVERAPSSPARPGVKRKRDD